MRHLILFIFVALIAVRCVKQPSTDPVPSLEFKDVTPLGKVAGQGTRDTAVVIFRYNDGDGDLFNNSSKDQPNLICRIFTFNTDSNKFDVNNVPYSILQPANGYYKKKSIYGDLYVPMRQFRPSDKVKMVRFEIFMVDIQKHQSNTISSPVYTLN
jgi:hypothetical protein